jgi:hypothetical protein
MSFSAPLSLDHYFVVAARMQHHFESNLVAVEESGVAALQDADLAAFELFSGPRGNFMYYWYASLCVVVQGFRNLKLVDPGVAECQGTPPVLECRLPRKILMCPPSQHHVISGTVNSAGSSKESMMGVQP